MPAASTPPSISLVEPKQVGKALHLPTRGRVIVATDLHGNLPRFLQFTPEFIAKYKALVFQMLVLVGLAFAELAARLEAHTKAASCDVLIDADTHHALAGSVSANPLGPVQFKGFSQTMEIYAIAPQG